ncbi:zinc finger protein VAR3, chloroplastic [Typha angustifolia]|uniref:zinc finger protein VAR3, chloroplastic n=1 Tax=Typha angustifolia TaxID=59011 RepID=UPI003C2B9D6E
MGGASKLLMLLSTPFPHLYRRSSALRLASLSPAAAAVARRRRMLSTASRPLPDLSAHVHTHAAAREAFVDPSPSPPIPSPSAALPWPEWSRLLDHIAAGGYADRPGTVGLLRDEFLDREGLQDEFFKAAEACLSFARARPELLRLLPKKDLEVIVENGSPFLFKNGDDSTRRMRSFLNGGDNNVMGSERAETVDVIRYLLSYLCSHHDTLDPNYSKAKELTDASVRNLLAELVNAGATVQASSFTESTPRDLPLRQSEQIFRPPGKNIEMKRGDWICPKCSFMNFARNMKCLECSEVRPKRMLTGGEWECPQCDFFNYGRNMSCLRCDCKRPGQIPMSSAPAAAGLDFNTSSNFDQILHGSNTDKSEIERKLAASDEKAERWFNKVSQLNDSADLSSLAADEDFPEIMPMRKGVNRFVVSTRKTPLERRLANAHNSKPGIVGPPEGSGSQPGGLSGMGSDRSSASSISQTLDRILGRSTATSETNNQPSNGETDAGAGNKFYSSEYRQNLANQRRDSGYVPFVPLPADMFAKSANTNADVQTPDKDDPTFMKADLSVTQSSGSPTESRNIQESPDAADRWSKKVAELDNVTDLSSKISGEDFPEIMPIRKGENRFVISKKKDRSLTSPQYKRRIALEQANNSNFVPFVPFPPDYFAKKDKQAEGSPTMECTPGGSQPSEKVLNPESNVNTSQESGRQSSSQSNNESWGTSLPLKTLNESKLGSADSGMTDNLAHNHNISGYSYNKDSWNSGYSNKSTQRSGNVSVNPQQSSSNSGESWNKGFSGKSLEGSAVKEPDPLDMSEEAKAERWFRRAAQIKDISELANIPDEDFPEIMPMRKGVNRFVVSKRKTPLERRLTSPQYRRNLPIVSSEPEKDAS